ncbi:SDR family NAD(P)-dependent oxidoreductase [Parendozoicomonas haliclonae]|uniref:Erythronolide synthase, modules 1 and 2 n=1 Tax=Parendozoicomonas haliclonae TaxID=1960125 RepID=A0A1X7AGI6_9GAMM|nr:SDR family NAD(P)-dependent oxidoreductase [Parendozoicomonas haliclonae]SMA38347.1 Erythronolide synthase, modules 1 and 2 [Parendozoicomonas haliclonae]
MDHPLQLVPVSGHTPAALITQCHNLVAYLEGHEVSLEDLAYTLGVYRSHFVYRLAVCADSVSDLCQKLNSFLAVYTGEASPEPLPDSCFYGDAHSQKSLSESGMALADRGLTERSLKEVARFYVEGNEIAFKQLYPDQTRCRLDLPVYPFQRKRHWVNTELPISDHNKSTGTDNLLFHYEWVATPLSAPVAGYFPSPISMTGTVADAVVDVSNRQWFQAFDSYRDELDRLTSHYMVAAFVSLGVSVDTGTCIPSADQLADTLGIVDNQRRLFRLLFKRLVAAGYLKPDDSGENWCWQPSVSDVMLDEPESVPAEPSPASRLLHATGPKLADVLLGRVKPEQLIFPNNDTSLVNALYRDSADNEYISHQIKQVLEQLIETIPAGGELKILEIGAGTGGTTEPLLEYLQSCPGHFSYAFSDISPVLLKDAEKRLGHFNGCGGLRLSFTILDIEQDSISDGEQGYDLVIASNVLHATQSIADTLTHTRALLHDGGWLLLQEAANPGTWIDIVFGLLEGWWKFSDTKLRSDNPLLSPGSWCKQLELAGFDQAMTPVPAECPQTLILARAPIKSNDYNSNDHNSNGSVQVENTCLVVQSGQELPSLQDASASASGKTTDLCWHLPSLTLDTADDPLDLIQPLIRQFIAITQWINDAPAPPRLHVLCQQAFASKPSEDVQPLLAPILALVRTLASEVPETAGVIVDADQPVDTDWLLMLANSQTSDIYSLRRKRLFTRGLINDPDDTEVDVSNPLLTAAKGTWLIAGTGGMALLTTRWLARQGIRTVILFSRHGLSQDQTPALKRLETEYPELKLSVEQIDICDAQAMEQLGQKLISQGDFKGKVQGIVHCAGSLDDGVVRHQTAERIAQVLGAKVQGGWNLHRLAEALMPEYVLLFSSAATLSCPPGLGAYAAGNCFLDALAEYRLVRGEPALALDWGAVKDVGVERVQASNTTMASTLQALDIKPMTPVQAMDGMTRAFRLQAQQAYGSRVVSPIDPQALGAHGDSLPAVFRTLAAQHIPEVSRPKSNANPINGQTGLRSLLREQLRAQIRKSVQSVLDEQHQSLLTDQASFQELGMDSLKAVELRNQLVKALGQPLSSSVLFDYPSVDALVEHIRPLLAETESVEETVEPENRLQDASDKRTPHSDAVAIIGMGCRFPGAESPDAFWELLSEGLNTVGELPVDRRRLALDQPVAGPKGHGGYLNDIDMFDPLFFDIPPSQAASLDPQQRVLLETAWQAIEQAGLAKEQLWNSRTSVFVGLYHHDYQKKIAEAGVEELDGWTLLGSEHSTMAGRLSYWLGLRGANMPVNTACSSSLVSLHLACQGLINGESDLALAGGVSLLLSSYRQIYFDKLGALSSTGQCRPFGQEADGFVPAEGCGVLVLKRLADAERDNDNILAVIRGSAVNQDGRSQGLTAPNGPAQAQVIQEALDAAALQPTDIDYLEAHGTGTALGDPIEINALASVFHERSRKTPLQVGSVKSNIGHSEAAAGVAGVIKTVLAMQHGQLPASLSCTPVSRQIRWDAIPISVVRHLSGWPETGRPYRAGVSAFGFSGTNAHLILEQAPARKVVSRTQPALEVRSWQLVLLSARSPESLRAMVEEMLAYCQDLADSEAVTAENLAWNLAVRRSSFEYRLIVPAENLSDLYEELEQWLAAHSGQQKRCDPLAADETVLWLNLPEAPDALRQLVANYRSEQTFMEVLEHWAAFMGIALEGLLLQLSEPAQDSPNRDLAIAGIGCALVATWRLWGINGSSLVAEGLALPGILSDDQSLDDAFAMAQQLVDKKTTGRADPHLLKTCSQLVENQTVPIMKVDTEGMPSIDSSQLSHSRVVVCVEPLSAQYDLQTCCFSDPGAGLQQWFMSGGSVNWKAVWQGREGQPLDLPGYPWNRSAYWLHDASKKSVTRSATTSEIKSESLKVYQRVWQALQSQTAADSNIKTDDNSHVIVWPTNDQPGRDVFSAVEQQFQALKSHLVNESLPEVVWVLTRQGERLPGDISAGSDIASSEQSAIRGFVRGIAQEYPDLTFVLLDIGARDDAAEVIQQLKQRDEYRQYVLSRSLTRSLTEMAYRRGQFYRPILQESSSSPENNAPLLSGQALITGGLGSLGLHTALWLVEQGIEQLVLVSRHRPEDPERQQLLEQLQSRLPQTGSLQIELRDIGEPDVLANLLATMRSRSSDSIVVYHCAGVSENLPLAELDLQTLRNNMRPKVMGFEALASLPEDLRPDHIICFSSLASVTGRATQSAYCAANAWLDAGAERLSREGLSCRTISWGPWQAGMATRSRTLDALSASGIYPLTPHEALGRLSATAATGHSVVADLSEAMRERINFSESQNLDDEPEHSFQGEDNGFLDQYFQAAEIEKARLLTHWLKEQVLQLMGMEPDAALSEEEGFFALGMDSMMMVSLANTISKNLGLTLDAALIISAANLGGLARKLLPLLDKQCDRFKSPRSSPNKDNQATLVEERCTAAVDPVVILGSSCTLPGGVNDLDQFWQLLAEGRCTREKISPDRWPLEGFYSPDQDRVDRSYCPYGHFVELPGIEEALFYGISPREAEKMDPQQILLLKNAWLALENACLVPDDLRGERVGVFLGIGPPEFSHTQRHLRAETDMYSVTGSHISFAAGRLAHSLGLQGPCMAVDTACSSTLTALHLACQALDSGDCDLALVAGVQTIMLPQTYIALCRARAISADGLCKAFADNADGYSRGEGCGVLVLTRESRADQLAIPAQAKVASTAINHDGAGPGLTVPNSEAQQRLVQQALGKARLSEDDIGYLEAHGTGTRLGDPLEVMALAEVFAARRSPLPIGSVKGNIGHLEAGAGMAGLLKVMAAMRHRQLPPHLHAQTLNRQIPWQDIPVQVCQSLTPWPVDDSGTLYAGISSFGLSGSNAHVILASA